MAFLLKRKPTTNANAAGGSAGAAGGQANGAGGTTSEWYDQTPGERFFGFENVSSFLSLCVGLDRRLQFRCRRPPQTPSGFSMSASLTFDLRMHSLAILGTFAQTRSGSLHGHCPSR